MSDREFIEELAIGKWDDSTDPIVLEARAQVEGTPEHIEAYRAWLRERVGLRRWPLPMDRLSRDHDLVWAHVARALPPQWTITVRMRPDGSAEAWVEDGRRRPMPSARGWSPAQALRALRAMLR